MAEVVHVSRTRTRGHEGHRHGSQGASEVLGSSETNSQGYFK